MIIITSRANPLVKRCLQLQDHKYRVEYGLFIAEGIRTCQTLYTAGVVLEHLVYTKIHHATVTALFPPDKCVQLDQTVANKIAATTTSSGILGIFQIPSAHNLATLTPGIVLADVRTPGNMGALIRTAAALGVGSVVIVEGCDPWSPKVVQASTGAVGLVPLFQLSWDELVEACPQIPLCAMVVDSGKNPHEIPLKNCLLVIGNEAHGLPPAWIAQCQYRLTLPMPGNAESLNAAIAGSIALYLGYVGLENF
jgi:RNA methyltransferase, TrmH family